MMTKTQTLCYFLFPHMTLSSGDFQNLYILLPRLRVLEIARQAPIPEWAQQKVSGWPVGMGEELSARIHASIEAFRTFAEVHGGPGGILGFLSQALDETEELRFRIQEELREKSRPDANPAPTFSPQSTDQVRGKLSVLSPDLFQAALFMEIARELDEKELEIGSGYDRLSALEQEFRDILGIEDEESEQAETNLTPALGPDTNGLLYMLPKRIESWFRMLSLSSLSPLESMPVFVTCFPEVVEEVVEAVRTGCERNGKNFSAAAHLLGSIPRMDALESRQLRTLIEAPGMSEVLSSCHRDLEDFIRGAAGGEDSSRLEDKKRSLQGAFEKFCRKCEVSDTDNINFGLTVVKSVSFADVLGFSVASPAFAPWPWPPVFLSIAAGEINPLKLTR
ncbi:MAG TPA: hypothetical protein VEF34_13615 [Syntrophobacteraceae bacterium]|nr:hypothetical protein [Syntrophobacteraceae bacterium]